MKKYLLLFLVLFLYKNALAEPSNTLSIAPVAVDAATITASDENTRNNSVVSTYNAHDHTDISQTRNTLNVGDALAGNKTVTAYNADSNKPFLRYDDTNNYWIASTNGIAPSVVLQGTGITFEGTTDDEYETTFSITDSTADRTITIPNGDINFVTGLSKSYGGTGNTSGIGLPSGAVFFMVTGSCPTGSTDVSSTYSNKFVRINATPLSTGGADTFTITANNLPTHTHATGTLAAANESAHTHTAGWAASGSSSGVVLVGSGFTSGGTIPQTGAGSAHGHTISGSTGDNTTTATAIDTVPAYVTMKACQVD